LEQRLDATSCSIASRVKGRGNGMPLPRSVELSTGLSCRPIQGYAASWPNVKSRRKLVGRMSRTVYHGPL
jgi:hypothetical protein